jgi:MFS family permease
MVTFSHLAREGALSTRHRQPVRSRSRRATTVFLTLAVGTDPLRRSRDFRLLWLAAFASGIGMGAVGLAVLVQVYDLTGSPAAAGYLGFTAFAALLVGCVAGASIVDHLDRRTLLLLTQAGMGVSSAILLVGALWGRPPVILLYVASAIGAAAASLHFPTRSAMIPPIVGHDQVSTAMALELVIWNSTMILGPIIGGIVVARWGLVAVYALGVAGYGVATMAQIPITSQPPASRELEAPPGAAAIREGFAYLRPRHVLRALLVVDVVAMVFGMRRALFPLLAVQQFHRGPEVVGLLMAAIPVGALVVSATAGWLARVKRQGRVVLLAMGCWGAAVALFGTSGSHLWLGLLLLAAAGGADIVTVIVRATIIQRTVPDSLRGRISGINFMVGAGGPRLGDFQAGLAAAAFGPVFSVVSGGIACVVSAAVIALWVPELARYRLEMAEEAARQRDHRCTGLSSEPA